MLHSSRHAIPIRVAATALIEILLFWAFLWMVPYAIQQVTMQYPQTTILASPARFWASSMVVCLQFIVLATALQTDNRRRAIIRSVIQITCSACFTAICIVANVTTILIGFPTGSLIYPLALLTLMGAAYWVYSSIHLIRFCQ